MSQLALSDVLKLAGADWTATELASSLSEDSVRALISNFEILDQGTRARIFLAIALLSQDRRLTLQKELQVRSV